MKLKRIKIRNGWVLTNCCWHETENGMPMVGSKYCKEFCPYYKGTLKFLWWKFVKCDLNC